jgi:hypothetical protein
MNIFCHGKRSILLAKQSNWKNDCYNDCCHGLIYLNTLPFPVITMPQSVSVKQFFFVLIAADKIDQ